MSVVMRGLLGKLDWLLVVGLFSLTLIAWFYKSSYESLRETMKQKDAVIAEHEANQQKLKGMLEKVKQESEKKIKAAEARSKKEQERFNAQLEEHRNKLVDPVIVRVQQPAESYPRGSIASSLTTKTNNGHSGGSTGEAAFWVLSQSNSERLERALAEVEALSRDFNRAKDQLEICLTH